MMFRTIRVAVLGVAAFSQAVAAQDTADEGLLSQLLTPAPAQATAEKSVKLESSRLVGRVADFVGPGAG